MAQADEWSCRHFSLSNGAGPEGANLPRLLRRVAKEIERRDIQPIDLMDVSIKQEITAAGPWWAVTVYWSPDD